MNYAIEIKTANTPNGASRRGWLVYRSDGVLQGFLPSEGRGNYLLYHVFPDQVITLCSLNVPVKEYNTALRGPQVKAGA